MKGKAFQKAVKGLSVLALLLLVTTSMILAREETPSPVPAVEYFRIETEILDDGTSLDLVLINGPPTPPRGYERPTVDPSGLTEASASLSVPAYDWTYGCSATSASMIAAYYDRNGYPDMYTGTTGGGVMPMDNSVWGHTFYTRCDNGLTQSVGENPLTATHNGIDGRATAGHVDDYWTGYLCIGPDPWGPPGTEHPADSIGDYMNTNKWFSTYGFNSDGGTVFVNNTTGAPMYATTLAGMGAPYIYDGGLGLKQFYEARGYTVVDAYNQYRQGYSVSNPSQGFTYAQYKAEIDAGRPVMIHVEGHTMVGIGYDDSSGDLMYIHDTWDYGTQTMTWGSPYSGMPHVGVTIVQLAAPTSVDLASFSAEIAPDANAVQLNWETATELDNMGFNLYRARAVDGARVQLNGALIPAQNPGSALGANYSYLDAAVEANATYYYWLEDLDAYGMTTLHGPATVALPSRLRLRPLRPRPMLHPVLENLQ